MLPKKYKKAVATKLSTNYRDAVKIVEVETDFDDLKEDEVVIKMKYFGINASDINYTAGKVPFYTSQYFIYFVYSLISSSTCLGSSLRSTWEWKARERW